MTKTIRDDVCVCEREIYIGEVLFLFFNYKNPKPNFKNTKNKLKEYNSLFMLDKDHNHKRNSILDPWCKLKRFWTSSTVFC